MIDLSAVHSEQAWLEMVRSATLRGNFSLARATLQQALVVYPASLELRRAEAGVLQHIGLVAEAETILRTVLTERPGDTAAAFALAHMLKEQGRMAAAASIMRTCFTDSQNCSDPDLAISAIELLDNCERKVDAAAIAEFAITQNPDDARLHAYASMLLMQLGEFERARQHYLFALSHDEQAWEWHMPIGLSSAQRYSSREHPDFALFHDGLQRKGLSERARAELHFALGKAYDGIGDYDEAARHLREGNTIVHRLTEWSRKDWRRGVENCLATKPSQEQIAASANFTPIFIVGMPRSGTTLLAELLSRYPLVCNRGELPWIASLAEQPDLSGTIKRDALQRAANTYVAQSRQDDAYDARWFLDKQPLNFRHIDLMLAMFPHAKVIHCQRSSRDTALSLWMQCFTKDVQRYAYDFGDIAVVMRDEARLMAHWRSRYPLAIRDVRYEDVVADSRAIASELSTWLGLPPLAASGNAQQATAISTASLWQARQPVYSRSVGRWKNYATQIPELLRLPD